VNQSGRPSFLGLEESESGPWDIVVLQVPLEISVSYGEGTELGPSACIEASSQVELHDPILPAELPCGAKIHTAEPWSSDAPSLRGQLDSIREFLGPWMQEGCFPVILGGEHGILLPIVEAVSLHPTVRSLSELTIVQVDAHADLRDELNGEKLSHGTVMRRALDAGVGKIIQVGVRAFSKEEAEIIEGEDRVETWFGRDLFSVSKSQANWRRLLERISQIEGPVWLTFDIDGLDGSLVPSTGTPVPGGLSHWGAVELIETLFESPYVEVVGADVNEIVPDSEGSLTEFSAAMTAVKIVACHILARNLQKD
tara:strand:+ start:5464 stop:6396 length:933 start_codon:yes stop_codon:yes gene_type:complete